MKKRTLKLFLPLILLLCGALSYGHFKRTEGFCTSKIASHHPYQKIWDTKQPLLPKKILDQTYTYLGSGKECYAFLSEDQKYVIKFFKQKHMNSGHFFDKYSLASRKQKLETRKKLREKTYQSYQIAYHELSEETGTLYLHLTKTSHLNKKLPLIDQHGKPFSLNLDNMEFLIQKYAQPTFTVLNELILENRLTEAKELIDSILNLIINRVEKGISDLDINCERNIGIFGKTAMEIDIGEFSTAPPKSLKDELTSGTEDLKSWLHSHSPSLEEYLQKKLKQNVTI